MIILFQNIFLFKEFLACSGCFGLFTKIIKRYGTSFCCTFSAWFFFKNVLYLILHLWTKFQCHTFFLLKIWNKMATSKTWTRTLDLDPEKPGPWTWTIESKLKFCKLKVIFQSPCKLNSLFHYKDSIQKKIRSDIVYRYMCSNCKVTYYGKTIPPLFY